MTLADLRRTAIKSGVRVRFNLSNGMECVLNEHGVAQIPALRAVPTFDLEDELSRASQFSVEKATADKNKSRPQVLNREQLAAMVGTKSADAGHEEHED
jgi:hypothetical protein